MTDYYLNDKELAEIHGYAPDTVRNYRTDKGRSGRVLPEPDVVIGGGHLRGLVPGLPPQDETAAADGKKKRSDARYGYSPETALSWRGLSARRGARTDLHPELKGTLPSRYSEEQIDAARRVIACDYGVISLIPREPFQADEAEKWADEYRAASEARDEARRQYAALFAGEDVPVPVDVLRD